MFYCRVLNVDCSYIHYRQKNMDFFLFQRFCAILWSVQRVSELEIHTYEQILPLGEIIRT